jgi:signal peptidase II
MLKKKLPIHFGKKSILFVVIGVILLAVDLILKDVVERAELSGNSWNFDVIPSFIYVRGLTYNSGAAFSFLANASWGQVFLIAFTIIMVLALIALFLFVPEKYILIKLALSMIIAGAIGNLVDRIAMQKVRDFVWVNMFGKLACCNFADFWIVFGTIIAAIDVLFIADFAVFPLRKSVREAQKRKNEEASKGEGNGTVQENSVVENNKTAQNNNTNQENTAENPQEVSAKNTTETEQKNKPETIKNKD